MKTTFFNGNLHEKILMKQLEGFVKKREELTSINF
jgi:hypothetical protein